MCHTLSYLLLSTHIKIDVFVLNDYDVDTIGNLKKGAMEFLSQAPNILGF